MAICQNCGAQVPDGVPFCATCGAPIAAPVPPPAAVGPYGLQAPNPYGQAPNP